MQWFVHLNVIKVTNLHKKLRTWNIRGWVRIRIFNLDPPFGCRICIVNTFHISIRMHSKIEKKPKGLNRQKILWKATLLEAPLLLGLSLARCHVSLILRIHFISFLQSYNYQGWTLNVPTGGLCTRSMIYVVAWPKACNKSINSACVLISASRYYQDEATRIPLLPPFSSILSSFGTGFSSFTPQPSQHIFYYEDLFSPRSRSTRWRSKLAVAPASAPSLWILWNV